MIELIAMIALTVIAVIAVIAVEVVEVVEAVKVVKACIRKRSRYGCIKRADDLNHHLDASRKSATPAQISNRTSHTARYVGEVSSITKEFSLLRPV